MSIADLPIAEQLALAGGRKVRRYLNRSIYQTALRESGAESSKLRFMCECGDFDCPERVELRLVDFDEHFRPGTVLSGRYKLTFPDPTPPSDPKPPDPDPDPGPPGADGREELATSHAAYL